jgi:hypothetical protein
LGGLGGRCNQDPSLCTSGAPSALTQPDILIRNVASAFENGEQLDLHISNESEYRGWNVNLNGIKRVVSGASSGHFCVVNLLAPRAVGTRRYWHDRLTFADIRYTFVAAATGAARVVGRTLLTFYDFDAGREVNANGVRVATECIKVRGAADMSLNPATEIVNDAPIDDHSLELSASWAGWEAETIYCGSQYGVGADNPLNPLTLTPLEVSRAILIELRNVSSLLVRFAVYGCCATVRACNSPTPVT